MKIKRRLKDVKCKIGFYLLEKIERFIVCVCIALLLLFLLVNHLAKDPNISWNIKAEILGAISSVIIAYIAILWFRKKQRPLTDIVKSGLELNMRIAINHIYEGMGDGKMWAFDYQLEPLKTSLSDIKTKCNKMSFSIEQLRKMETPIHASSRQLEEGLRGRENTLNSELYSAIHYAAKNCLFCHFTIRALLDKQKNAPKANDMLENAFLSNEQVSSLKEDIEEGLLQLQKAEKLLSNHQILAERV